MPNLSPHLSPCSSRGRPTAEPVPAPAPAYLGDKRNKVFPEGKAAPNEPHSYDVMGQAHNVLVEPVRRKGKCSSSWKHRPVLGHRGRRAFCSERPGSSKQRPLGWPPRGRVPALTWKGWYMAGRWRTRSRTALLQSSCRDEAAWPELQNMETASKTAHGWSIRDRPRLPWGLRSPGTCAV